MIANSKKYLAIAIASFLNLLLTSPVLAATSVAEGSGPTTLNITLGSGITFTAVSYTGAGSVGFTSTAITYTPPDDFTGQSDITTGEDVTYTLSDGTQVTESITVTAVNDAPVAVDDTATVTEDASLTSITVLDDDSDADSDSLTVSAISYSGTGTAAINSDNARIDYTPAANFNGTDTITYTVSDGTTTDTGTLTITVTAVNDAPVAVDDTETITEGDSLTSFTVLNDDTDVDGDTITLASASISGNATVAINSDGARIDYTPSTNFSGTDTITYTISDGNGGTDTGTLTITVTAVNDAPIAVDDTATVTEDASLTSITVLDDDTDADSDSLTVSAISYSGSGTAAINSDNARIDYTPAANFNGTDTITYTVSDSNGGTDTGTLTITVSAVNDAPTIGSIPTLTTPAATDLTIDLVTDYVTDQESNAVISTSSVSAGSGSVAISSDGLSLTYTPATGFSGSTSISFTLYDGANTLSSAITISVVNPVVTNACSPTVGLGSSACAITPTNHSMRVLAFGLCTAAPTRPTSSSVYDLSNCQLIYDGRTSGGISVSLAGGGSVGFGSALTIPAYGTYTHGVVLVDNAFTVQGELVLSSGATPYCYIETGMTISCYAAARTAPNVTDTIGNFFELTPTIYSYTFSDDAVTVDLVTSESTASVLSTSDITSDAILAIQTFTSPQTFNESSREIDIGVKISEAVTMTNTTADTSPFSIRFTVQ